MAPMGADWPPSRGAGTLASVSLDDTTCPACGGAGGGPFGRAGSRWDDESYVCPRCEGLGVLRAVARVPEEAPAAAAVPGEAPVAPAVPDEVLAASARPGIAKTVPPPAAPERKKRRAKAG